MNDCLISRKAVIDVIHAAIESTASYMEHDLLIDIETKIDLMEAAYDVDEVCEELEKATGHIHYTEDASFNGKCIEDFEFIQSKTAIEIVRNGGNR